ncbi:hypothetical protein ACWCXK_06090 [Streptomyces sp. NPDC001739]
MDQDTTVAQLIERLSTYNPDAVIRLAIAPDFPFAHYLGAVIEGRDEDGAEAIFLADGGQQYYLPHAVAVALSWVSDPTAPAPARRRGRRSSPPQ